MGSEPVVVLHVLGQGHLQLPPAHDQQPSRLRKRRRRGRTPRHSAPPTVGRVRTADACRRDRLGRVARPHHGAGAMVRVSWNRSWWYRGTDHTSRMRTQLRGIPPGVAEVRTARRRRRPAGQSGSRPARDQDRPGLAPRGCVRPPGRRLIRTLPANRNGALSREVSTGPGSRRRASTCWGNRRCRPTVSCSTPCR